MSYYYVFSFTDGMIKVRISFILPHIIHILRAHFTIHNINNFSPASLFAQNNVYCVKDNNKSKLAGLCYSVVIVYWLIFFL